MDYIEWSENSQAVPQARPIVNFWYNCKNYYSKITSEPNGLIGFLQIWKNICKSLALTLAQLITRGIRPKLKFI